MTPPAVPPWPGEDHVCAACPMSYADLDVPGVAETLADAVAAVVAVVAVVAGQAVDALRARPADGSWSAVEYVCHLRDVHVAGTIRLHRIRTETAPVLEPMLNDLRARRFDYRHRDPAPVLDELAAAAEGVRAEARRTTDWNRVGVRRSEAGEERRTARWMLRQIVHETVHHRHDVERCVASR